MRKRDALLMLIVGLQIGLSFPLGMLIAQQQQKAEWSAENQRRIDIMVHSTPIANATAASWRPTMEPPKAPIFQPIPTQCPDFYGFTFKTSGFSFHWSRYFAVDPTVGCDADLGWQMEVEGFGYAFLLNHEGKWALYKIQRN